MPGSGATLHQELPLPAAEAGTHPFFDAVRLLPGRILVSWSMAGGLVAGGWLIAATTLTGRLSSSSVPQMSGFLFFLGMGAGLFHGGLLGYLTRDPSRPRAEVLGVLARALVWIVPGLLLAWLAALWISLTAAVTRTPDSLPLGRAATSFAWAFGLAACGWAAWEGARGLMAAYRRWPDFRVASVLLSLVFAVLVTAFLISPPLIWFTEIQVTGLWAVVLAFGATVWIALPVMIALLGLLHRVTGR
ncbi:MAG TPA: hypothetical protein VLL48_01020 [Longimicrobiales bacterium]|nr:hypothetical protein [Longimicrobiales bacterium]